MIYLKWKLSEGTLGTGPERDLTDRGAGHTFAAWCADSDGYRVGYAENSVDLSDLETWDVTEITQAQALAFCKDFDATVKIDSNGYVGTPVNPEDQKLNELNDE